MPAATTIVSEKKETSVEADRRSVRSRTPFLRFRAPISRRAESLIAIAASVGLLLAWEAAVRFGFLSGLFLPPPSVIGSTLWDMIVNQDLLTHASVSIARVWGAFLLATFMAIPIGIVMSGYRVIGAAMEPIVDFVRYLPVPALVPLSIIWFGVGEETKLFLLWLGTFFQLVLLVADDMRRVPQEYFEIAATLGASPSQAMRDVAFRQMLPSLTDNLRITLGWCWTYLIVAEIVAADQGLGFVIWAARRYMQTAQVMAGVVVIGFIGLVTDQILRLLRRRIFRYI